MESNRTLTGLRTYLGERWAETRSDLRQWRADVRDDPGVIFRTPLVRLGFLLVLSLCILFGVRWLANAMVPAAARAPITRGNQEAIMRVACTRPACLQSSLATVTPDFRAWPLTCERCKELGVYRAQRCQRCKGWYAIATGPDTPGGCPLCARREAEKPKPQSRPRSQNPDDDEDGW